MNKEEILVMEAGRELDELIAIKIMRDNDEIIVTDIKLYPHVSPYTHNKEGFIVGWHPSTDISAAMEALDKLKDDYDAVNLVYCNGSWQCILTTVTGSYEGDSDFNITDISYDSPNMAEAICITCLLAVME